MFNVLHARGDSECSGDGRQNTNRGLNHKLPYFLVLHNDLVFDFTLIDFFTLIFYCRTDNADDTDIFLT